MRFIKFVFGLFVSLIVFIGCTDDTENEFSCELKLKIIDTQGKNLLETGFYNSDTIFLYQDNIETKSYFNLDSTESFLSMSIITLNAFDMDNEFLLYLNHIDIDTLKMIYEKDPTIPCLGGLIIKTIKHNGQEMIKHGDTFFIEE